MGSLREGRAWASSSWARRMEFGRSPSFSRRLRYSRAKSRTVSREGSVRSPRAWAATISARACSASLLVAQCFSRLTFRPVAGSTQVSWATHFPLPSW